MKPYSTLGHCLLAALLTLLIACAEPPTVESPAAEAPTAETPAAEVLPLDIWWDHLNALCGKAFAGALTSADEADADMVDQAMVMHVRRCEPKRLEIPFHIGENRSRTWVLTRTDQGLQLQHDHRHEDGSEDTVTLYGGHTDVSSTDTEIIQHFPVDDFSKKLFEANGLSVSTVNVWSMEVVPGERFSYILRRPERHFQVDFDLTQTVDPPPVPWGHE